MQSAEAQQAAIRNQQEAASTQIAKQEQAQTNDRLRAARQEDSRIRVAAGEAGLSLGSQSIETMLMNNQMQTGLGVERIGLNADNQNENNTAEANAALSRAATPSALSAGLQLGLSGYQGFKAGENLKLQKSLASTKIAAGA
nr:hypothetical protein [Novosphingobium umbonatum]